MTVREFLEVVDEHFPNKDLDIIKEYKVVGRRFSVSHGKAISTTKIEGPNEEDSNDSHTERP